MKIEIDDDFNNRYRNIIKFERNNQTEKWSIDSHHLTNLLTESQFIRFSSSRNALGKYSIAEKKFFKWLDGIHDFQKSQIKR